MAGLAAILDRPEIGANRVRTPSTCLLPPAAMLCSRSEFTYRGSWNLFTYESRLAYGRLIAWQRNVQRPINSSGRRINWRRSHSGVLKREPAKEKYARTEPLNGRFQIPPKNLGQG